MTSPLKTFAALILLCVTAHAQRHTTEFATGWRFLQSDAVHAEAPSFDDQSWKSVTVPHDWAISGPVAESNPTGAAGAFLPSGVSWYRRHLQIADPGQQYLVEFDGVMAHSQVWINGHLLGHEANGYVSFFYDLTPFLHAGDNLLAVRTDTSQQPASRWYEGAGIYRKVYLIEKDPISVDQWGTYVTTPKVSAAQATVRLQFGVANHSHAAASVHLRVKLITPGGKVAATLLSSSQTVAASAMTHFDLATTLAQPDRWDTDHPALYTATVEVIAEDKLRDADSVVFGIRDAHFEAATGFWINGRNIKLLGVCLHEGAGAFGIAVPAEIYRDRLVALKALGVNAIRTSHNPPSPEFLALCDQLGLFVMDEAFDMWSVGKNPFDYHLDFPQDHVRDTMSIALRDRNHPSIVLWSAGNEIRDTKQSEIAKPELRTILDAFHAVDPSRPVTEALVQSKLSHDYEDGLADMLDVIGQNYRPDEIVEAHTDKPSRKIIGTENGQNLNEWLPVRDNAAYAGEFLWTGEDYLGEAHTWPAISHSTGLIDRTGGLHARGLERSSWWSTQPVVFLVRHVPGGVREKFAAHDIETAFADWTPNSLAPHDEQVDVYSNCSAVTLSLNGASLGSKPRNADDTPRTWLVHFAPGAITALCGDNRTAITLKTAGPADHIQLTSLSDHVGTTFDDATELRAVIVDAAGIPVPRAANLLHFTVEGPAKILAVDNADNISHEPFQATQRFAYEGTAVAYIRATGSGIIHITADAANLHAGVATIQAIQ